MRLRDRIQLAVSPALERARAHLRGVQASMEGRAGQSAAPELGAAVTACVAAVSSAERIAEALERFDDEHPAIPDLLCALASAADAAEQARRVVEHLTAATRPFAGGLVQ